jgi:hypothetical protein
VNKEKDHDDKEIKLKANSVQNNKKLSSTTNDTLLSLSVSRNLEKSTDFISKEKFNTNPVNSSTKMFNKTVPRKTKSPKRVLLYKTGFSSCDKMSRSEGKKRTYKHKKKVPSLWSEKASDSNLMGKVFKYEI